MRDRLCARAVVIEVRGEIELALIREQAADFHGARADVAHRAFGCIGQRLEHGRRREVAHFRAGTNVRNRDLADLLLVIVPDEVQRVVRGVERERGAAIRER